MTKDPRPVLRFNLHAGLTSLDPAQAGNESNVWMCQQLFSTLVGSDSLGQLAPDAAHDWRLSPDGLQYTFHVRRDLYFHPHPCFGPGNTRRLTSRDFAFSFHRVCQPATGSPGLWVFRNTLLGAADYHAGKADTIAGIYCPDDSTLVLRLAQPFPPFLQLLAMPYAAAVPAEAVAWYGKEFRRHPVGTGPFCFFRWEEGRLLVLHAYTRYHQPGLPRVSALAVSFIPSKLGAFSALLERRIDFIDGIDPSYQDALLDDQGLLAPEYRSRLRLYTGPQLTVEYVGLHTADPGSPLQDVRVRRALAYATDRAGLARHLLRNTVRPALRGFVPPGLGICDSFLQMTRALPYDPARARQLLAAAGYPGGRGLPVLQFLTTASHAQAASYLQQGWTAAGFRVEISVEDAAALRQQVRTGSARLWRASWVADYADPENFLALFYSPNHPPAGSNNTRYYNSRFDALYHQYLKEPRPEERCALAARLDSMVAADCPAVPLYYYNIWRTALPRVEGLPQSSMNLNLPLKYVRVHR
ncbi:MAG: ABC transporter substrate-binding protein [Bacteroidetes bacterium]|nr:ABC transporter substrate-binding protein [Bacteroidota bacterium]